MCRVAVLALAAGALALSGLQAVEAGDYVKRPGPTLEVATAYCKDYAAKASHIVIGVGSIEAAALGLFATIAATASKRVHAFDDCMAVQGYQKAGAKAPPQPAPALSPTVPAKAAAPKAVPPAKKAPTKAG